MNKPIKAGRVVDWNKAYFVFNYTYGSLERCLDMKFEIYSTEKKANISTRRFSKEASRRQKGYCGNMHADTSHLDFELVTKHGISAFQEYCKTNKFKINWGDRTLTAQEDITVTVSARDYKLIRSNYKDYEQFQKVLQGFVEKLKQEAKRKQQKENSR